MEPTDVNPSSLPYGADDQVRARQALAQRHADDAGIAQRRVVTPPSVWSRVPVVIWVALGVGALAFAARLSYRSTSVGSDGYSCSYTDVAGYLAAAAIVVLTVIGWVRRAGTHVALRLPLPLVSALTVLLAALAFVHALRGSGTIMSPCDARPMP